jgi:hypothetical protein
LRIAVIDCVVSTRLKSPKAPTSSQTRVRKSVHR